MDDGRRQVMDAGRAVMEKGLTWGTSGNISLREGDRVWITASGTRMGALEEEDILVLSLDGTVLEGEKKPSKETGMHLEVYRRRTDVGGIVHCSPFYGTLCASSDLPLKTNLFIEAMYYDRAVRRIPYYHAGSRELAQVAGEASEEANVIFMGNHGLLTLDVNLPEALTAMEITEQVCRMNALASMGNFALREVDRGTVNDFLTGGYYKRAARFVGECQEKNIGKSI